MLLELYSYLLFVLSIVSLDNPEDSVSQTEPHGRVNQQSYLIIPDPRGMVALEIQYCISVCNTKSLISTEIRLHRI